MIIMIIIATMMMVKVIDYLNDDEDVDYDYYLYDDDLYSSYSKLR